MSKIGWNFKVGLALEKLPAPPLRSTVKTLVYAPVKPFYGPGEVYSYVGTRVRRVRWTPPKNSKSGFIPPPKRSAHPSRVRRGCFDPPSKNRSRRVRKPPPPLKKFWTLENFFHPGTLDSLISIDPWISIDPGKISQKIRVDPENDIENTKIMMYDTQLGRILLISTYMCQLQ